MDNEMFKTIIDLVSQGGSIAAWLVVLHYVYRLITTCVLVVFGWHVVKAFVALIKWNFLDEAGIRKDKINDQKELEREKQKTFDKKYNVKE